jgi:hypothetical protein
MTAPPQQFQPQQPQWQPTAPPPDAPAEAFHNYAQQQQWGPQPQPEPPGQKDSILETGAGGPPCISFAVPPYIYGTPQGGTILQPYKIQQTRNQKTNEPEFWPKSGEAKQTLVFVVQTGMRTGPDDDGVRRLFLDKNYTNVPDSQWSVFADAVERAGAPGPRPGGVLLFAVLGKRKGDQNMRNVWACQYTPPSPEAEAYYTEQAAKAAAGPPDSVMSTPLGNGQQPQQQPNYVQPAADGPVASPFPGNAAVPAAPATVQWGPQSAAAPQGGQPWAPQQPTSAPPGQPGPIASAPAEWGQRHAGRQWGPQQQPATTPNGQWQGQQPQQYQQQPAAAPQGGQPWGPQPPAMGPQHGMYGPDGGPPPAEGPPATPPWQQQAPAGSPYQQPAGQPAQHPYTQQPAPQQQPGPVASPFPSG